MAAGVEVKVNYTESGFSTIQNQLDKLEQAASKPKQIKIEAKGLDSIGNAYDKAVSKLEVLMTKSQALMSAKPSGNSVGSALTQEFDNLQNKMTAAANAMKNFGGGATGNLGNIAASIQAITQATTALDTAMQKTNIQMKAYNTAMKQSTAQGKAETRYAKMAEDMTTLISRAQNLQQTMANSGKGSQYQSAQALAVNLGRAVQELTAFKGQATHTQSDLNNMQTAADALRGAMARSTDEMKKFNQETKAAAAQDKLVTQYEKVKSNLQGAIDKAKELQQTLNGNGQGNGAVGTALNNGIAKAEQTMQQFGNSAVVSQAAIQNMQRSLNGLSAPTQAAQKSIQQYQQSIGQTQSMMSQLGSTGKEVLAAFGVTSAIYTSIRAMKDMAKQSQAVDTSMTDLAKVTDVSQGKLDAYYNTASKRAAELSVNLTDYIQATTEFSRLGENLTDATALGELATIYYNVGDGVDSVSDAASNLISTLKGFSLGNKDAQRVVDMMNFVGNNYAITSGGVGAILSRSASSMNVANTSLEKTIALGVAANTVVQNEEKVGTALSTLSMRLRGSKTELEAAGEETDEYATSTSKLRDEIKSLTKVDIMKDSNTFKDVYDILGEISERWDSLTDTSRANVSEVLFGKMRANVGNAILTNFDIARDVYANLTNGSANGSAMKEYSTYLNSVDAAQAKFQATYQAMSASIMDSDLLKFTYNTGSGVLGFVSDLATGLGSIPTLAGAAGAVLSTKLTNLHVTGFDKETGKMYSPLWQWLTGKTDEQYQGRISAAKAGWNQQTAELANDGLWLKKMQAATEGTEKYTDSYNKLTSAGKKFADGQKLTTEAVEDYTKKTREAINNNYKVAVAEAKSERTTGVGAALKSFGANLVSNLVMAGAMTLVSKGIEWGAKEIDSYVNADKYAAQAAADVGQLWKTSSTDGQARTSLVDNQFQTYLRYRSGVDQTTGQNISLTTSELEAYHTAVNEIATTLGSSVVSGWDSNNNAILTAINSVKQFKSIIDDINNDQLQENLFSKETKDFYERVGKLSPASFQVEEAKEYIEGLARVLNTGDTVEAATRIQQGLSSGNYKIKDALFKAGLTTYDPSVGYVNAYANLLTKDNAAQLIQSAIVSLNQTATYGYADDLSSLNTMRFLAQQYGRALMNPNAGPYGLGGGKAKDLSQTTKDTALQYLNSLDSNLLQSFHDTGDFAGAMQDWVQNTFIKAMTQPGVDNAIAAAVKANSEFGNGKSSYKEWKDFRDGFMNSDLVSGLSDSAKEFVQAIFDTILSSGADEVDTQYNSIKGRVFVESGRGGYHHVSDEVLGGLNAEELKAAADLTRDGAQVFKSVEEFLDTIHKSAEQASTTYDTAKTGFATLQNAQEKATNAYSQQMNEGTMSAATYDALKEWSEDRAKDVLSQDKETGRYSIDPVKLYKQLSEQNKAVLKEAQTALQGYTEQRDKAQQELDKMKSSGASKDQISDQQKKVDEAEANVRQTEILMQNEQDYAFNQIAAAVASMAEAPEKMQASWEEMTSTWAEKANKNGGYLTPADAMEFIQKNPGYAAALDYSSGKGIALDTKKLEVLYTKNAAAQRDQIEKFRQEFVEEEMKSIATRAKAAQESGNTALASELGSQLATLNALNETLKSQEVVLQKAVEEGASTSGLSHRATTTRMATVMASQQTALGVLKDAGANGITASGLDDLLKANPAYAQALYKQGGILSVDAQKLFGVMEKETSELIKNAQKDYEAYAAERAAYLDEYHKAEMAQDKGAMAEIQAKIAGVSQQMLSRQADIQTLEAQSSLYAQWQLAKQLPEAGDEFRELAGAVDTLRNGIKSGRTNTNVYAAAGKMIFGEDSGWETWGNGKVMSRISEIGKLYKNGELDNDQLSKWLKQKKIIDQDGKSLYDNLEDIAKELGLSKEFTASILKAASEYGKNDFSNWLKEQIDELTNSVQDSKSDEKQDPEVTLIGAVQSLVDTIQGLIDAWAQKDKEGETPAAESKPRPPVTSEEVAKVLAEGNGPRTVVDKHQEKPSLPTTKEEVDAFLRNRIKNPTPVTTEEVLERIGIPTKEEVEKYNEESRRKLGLDGPKEKETQPVSKKEEAPAKESKAPAANPSYDETVEQDKSKNDNGASGGNANAQSTVEEVVEAGEATATALSRLPAKILEKTGAIIADIEPGASKQSDSKAASDTTASNLSDLSTQILNAFPAVVKEAGKAIGAVQEQAIESVSAKPLAAPTDLAPVTQTVSGPAAATSAATSGGAGGVDVVSGVDVPSLAGLSQKILESFPAAVSIEVEADASGAAAQVESELDAISGADVTVNVNADASEAQSEIDAISGADVEVDVTADTSAAQAAINSVRGGTATVDVQYSDPGFSPRGGGTVTVDVQYNDPGFTPKGGSSGGGPGKPVSQMSRVNGFASGTRNAPAGTSLVGEAGAEIIVDMKHGKWSLADRPMLASLNKGDIVFNAKETRDILSANPSALGGRSYAMGLKQVSAYVRDGGGVAKRSTTTSKSTTTGTLKSKTGNTVNNTTNNTTNNFTIKGGSTPSWMNDDEHPSWGYFGDRPNTKNNNISTGANTTKQNSLLDAVNGLYDHVERALELAAKRTQDLIDLVADKIGAIAQNKALDDAINEVLKEIELNEAGLAEYQRTANWVQETLKIDDTIVKKLQDGAIEVANYGSVTGTSSSSVTATDQGSTNTSGNSGGNKIANYNSADFDEAYLAKLARSGKLVSYGKDPETRAKAIAATTGNGTIENAYSYATQLRNSSDSKLMANKLAMLNAHDPDGINALAGKVGANGASGNDDLVKAIGEYANWQSKIDGVNDSLKELKAKLKELYLQKLDNIVDYYELVADRSEAAAEYASDLRDYLNAIGKELKASDFTGEISALQKRMEVLQTEREAYSAQMKQLEEAGILVEDSNEWHKRVEELEKMDSTLLSIRKDIQGLQDDIAQLPITQLEYALSRLTATENILKGFMAFHSAQGTDNTEADYIKQIQNWQAQIENLSKTNEELKKMEAGLDEGSEKWQNLQKQIEGNNSSLWTLKANIESANDAMLDLSIAKLQEQREELQKTNDQLQRELNLQEALEELEKSKQRKKLIYAEGKGFYYSSDQKEVREAQQKVDELMHEETIAKIDEVIDRLDELKKEDNVYDYSGENQIKTFDLSSGASALYQSIVDAFDFSSMANDLQSALSDYAAAVTNNNATSITIGDIHIRDASNAEELAQAIKTQLGPAVLQTLYNK